MKEILNLEGIGKIGVYRYGYACWTHESVSKSGVRKKREYTVFTDH